MAKRANLKPSAVVFEEEEVNLDEAPDWVKDNLVEGVRARLTVKRLEEQAKDLKVEANEKIEAALAYLKVKKMKSNLGTVLVVQGAPIFARTVAQEELVRLGVSADVVAKAWKKATKPGNPVVQFRPARIA